MIGPPTSSSTALFFSSTLRPLNPPLAPAPGRPGAATWLDGLGAGGPASLRADVAADQRGLSVQQHAERVLGALLG